MRVSVSCSVVGRQGHLATTERYKASNSSNHRGNRSSFLKRCIRHYRVSDASRRRTFDLEKNTVVLQSRRIRSIKVNVSFFAAIAPPIPSHKTPGAAARRFRRAGTGASILFLHSESIGGASVPASYDPMERPFVTSRVPWFLGDDAPCLRLLPRPSPRAR